MIQRYLGVFILLSFFTVNTVYAQRYALVIGNSHYGRDLGNLSNPVNDASDMARLLKKKDFNVIKLTNATKKEMAQGIRRFTKQLQQKQAVGLFFFAGHGVEVGGRNYLIPVKANIETEAEVEFESIDSGRVMKGMELAGNNLNMIILDACRNNPYARSFRSASRGLAKSNPPKGSLILYATSPGEVASDGAGRNGLFTQHLLKAIDTPNITVEKVFKKTANGVYKAAAKKQLPWQSGVMLGDFYFSGQKMAVAPKVKPIGLSNNNQQAEIAFWQSIADKTSAAYFQSYLDQYPAGTYVNLARLELEKYRIPNEVLKQHPQLTIKTSPENARIRLLNIAPKYRQGMTLKAGRYHIEVSQAGYQRHREWFNLDDQHQSLYVQLSVKPVIKPKPMTRNLGVVTDSKTHLIWMRCSLGQTWTGSTCQGTAAKFTFQQALDKARGFSYAGYSNWRVPTIKELNTLVYCSNGKTIHYKQQGYHNQKTEGGNGCEGDSGDPHQKPTIVKTIFPNTVSGGYWSSSPNMDDSKVAWGVYFSAGHDYYDYRYYSRYVRLVRAVQ